MRYSVEYNAPKRQKRAKHKHVYALFPHKHLRKLLSASSDHYMQRLMDPAKGNPMLQMASSHSVNTDSTNLVDFD